jgi:hypothetical protein
MSWLKQAVSQALRARSPARKTATQILTLDPHPRMSQLATHYVGRLVEAEIRSAVKEILC